MQKTLVLETSTPIGSISVVEPDGRIRERGFGSDRRHNSALFAPLQELLDGVTGLDLVLVGAGPGSYSGTRVGIAAAQGVAIAMGCPAVALPSLLGIAEVVDRRRCLMLGDARRGTFWMARIEDGWATAPLLQEGERWRQTVLAACGEGLDLVSFEEESHWKAFDDLEVRKVTPTASHLWKAWNRAEPAQRAEWQGRIPQPMYLKPPHITKTKRTVLSRRN